MSNQLILKVNTRLKQKGCRQSNLRDKMISILDLSDEPVAVNDIINLLDRERQKPNKTTVYRELYTLLKNGFISEVDFGDGKKRYELATENTHPHLICTSCRSIKCVKLNITIESWLSSFCTQNNFVMTNHTLNFYGVCDKCN